MLDLIISVRYLGFSKKDLAAIPHVDQESFEHGNPIRGKFHNKGRNFPPEDGGSKQAPHENSQDNPKGIDRKDGVTGFGSEECPSQQYVHREPGRTGHKGIDQNC